MKSAIDHLRAALAEIRRERDTLKRQIEDADRQAAILEGLVTDLLHGVPSGPASVEAQAAAARASAEVKPSIREVATSVAREKATFSLPDVIDAAKEAGNDAQYASVSSILSRMVKEGDLFRAPGRGRFTIDLALAAETGGSDSSSVAIEGKDDEGPAEAGPSHDVDESQEGGDSNGTPVAPEG